MSHHDQHEAHTGPITSPKQLVWASIGAFVIPVFVIIGLVYYVTSANKEAPGASDAERAVVTRVVRMAPDERLEDGTEAAVPLAAVSRAKLEMTAAAQADERYVVCNADESEPGTFKDRQIIHKDPHQLIEGMIISCWANDVKLAYLYIRGEMPQGAKVLNKALDEARAKNFLGKNILGSGYDLEIYVHRGAGAYICGEETGMLSSIEGGRGYPKIKPPFPAVSGVFKCPTIVNNVETIAAVSHILKHGAAWHKQWGTEKSPGFKIFCLSGAVKNPGVYEVPLGITMREMIEVYGGGLIEGRTLKAVIPGGLSAPLLTPEMVDKCTLDYESLASLGSMLGSGGITVLHDGVDLMSAVYNTMRFYHHESCGQCTPCREGTGWLEKLAHKFHGGHAHSGDVDLVGEVAKNMRGRTICVLADAAAMPMQSYLQHFRGEFEKRTHEPAHVERLRTPRDEITPTAKRESVQHGAPNVVDVGMGMDRV